MGMAASQARFLALAARKSNCEYEGQQINQARMALSNQSANLFNQMLGLQVPVPPSTQDYTKVQYSYSDGINGSTIESWKQLATPEEDFNYVVTHYYYTDVYTGSEKKLSDPQVQFTNGEAPTDPVKIKTLLDAIAATKATYDAAVVIREMAENDAEKLSNYALKPTPYDRILNCQFDIATDKYTFNYGEDSTGSAEFTGYNTLDAEKKARIDQAIEDLISVGALSSKYGDVANKSAIYYNEANDQIAFRDDLNKLNGMGSVATETKLSVYSLDDETGISKLVNEAQDKINEAKVAENEALNAYNDAKAEYEKLNVPTFIGNSELTPIASLTDEQEAEIRQIVADMKEQGLTSDIINYYDPTTGAYTGGLYSFKMNGVTYYTTYTDLKRSYDSGTGINKIDGQEKLAYYNATYISTKIEKTEKALLETDGNGRFSTIRFQDDSITYSLEMETVTDNVAYQDAMNQYYYESAKYDKLIQDINAKTSLIHQQDRQLELRLKQLDTEHNALSTEIEAVQKVVKDNVDKSFKTFGS